MLTPVQLAEIRERGRRAEQGAGYLRGWPAGSPAHPNDFRAEADMIADIPALLAALDAANAENERLRKALGVIAKYDSDRQPGCEHCCSDIARTSLEGKKT